MNNDLSRYKKNIHSQTGEDGIIEEILGRLKKGGVSHDRWCVELGAWDGIYLSNTYALIKDRGYKAVLIEGDPKRYAQLCKNIPQEDVHKVCQRVSFDGDASLDRLLSATPIPKNFDFLSIDIDGCDYYIFESLNDYAPKIICIEYNKAIPNEVEYVQEKNFAIKRGSSARSLIHLADKKNYALVAVTVCNLIFVHHDVIQHVVTDKPTLEDLRDDSNEKVFLFAGFDGTILSNKKLVQLNWHGVHQNISDIQYLPKPLRIFFGDYSKLHKLFFAVWIFCRHPATFIKILKQRIKSI